MTIGPLQEQSGAWSSRRIAGSAFVAVSLYSFALRDGQWPFWSGVAAGIFALVLFGLTTISDIKELASVVRGKKGEECVERK